MLTRIALLLIVLIAVPYYWLFMDPGPTTVPPKSIDIARLRALADRMEGPRPVGVEHAAVATDTEPGILLVAGGGLRGEETAVLVWRLITPGGDTVINSGLTENQALAAGYNRYDRKAQATVNGWMRSARRIIFTSEDIDHVGGLVTDLPSDSGMAAKVLANAEQSSAIRALAPVFAQKLAPPLPALEGTSQYGAIAPGIAAVRTPGHLAGTQMIYVRLQDGREYLFAGDCAPMRRNVDWQVPRSRYAAEWKGREDRAATLGWIKGLAQLKAKEPGLTIVYGHDFGWLLDPVNGPHIAAAAASAKVPPARAAQP
jgi:glyoxylase-like metal-dependent hydrolase (beta-lactamase superfamily II)